MAVIERHVLAESAAFFAKKTAKKLLFAGGCGNNGQYARSLQTFFAAFFQNRSSCFFLRTASQAALPFAATHV
jgi:hypothetical protein